MKSIRQLILLFGILFCSILSNAQTVQNDGYKSWYVGAKGGVPLGVSNFSSFGEGKSHIGYNLGAFAGYDLNRIFSAEVSASFGNMGLNYDKHYGYNWLDSDNVSYLAPVAGAPKGYYYNELYSSVGIQQLGLHLNINLVSLFSRTSRFNFVVSPAIYGIGTQAKIMTTAGDNKFLTTKDFGFGVGGDVSIGYRVSPNLTVALSSGINHVMTNRIDGIPQGGFVALRPDKGQQANFVMNNNIRFTWRFGKKAKPAPAPAPVVYKPKTEEPKPTPPPVEKPRPVVITPITLPSIYFDLDKSDIKVDQLGSMMEIIALLKKVPDMEVVISGSTCDLGSEGYNATLSQERADAIKLLLLNNGIESSRIKAIGEGIDTVAPSSDDARRADVKQIKK